MSESGGRRVHKPWGHELVWAETEHYVGKLLVIEAGKRLSLQYHRQKDESIYVLRGTLHLHLEGEDGAIAVHALEPGCSWRIPTGRTHRFEARDERVELMEVSTPELDDVVRVEDDFGRSGSEG